MTLTFSSCKITDDYIVFNAVNHKFTKCAHYSWVFLITYMYIPFDFCCQASHVAHKLQAWALCSTCHVIQVVFQGEEMKKVYPLRNKTLSLPSGRRDWYTELSPPSQRRGTGEGGSAGRGAACI